VSWEFNGLPRSAAHFLRGRGAHGGGNAGKFFRGRWKKRIDIPVLEPFLGKRFIPRKIKQILSLCGLAEQVISSSSVMTLVPPTPTRENFPMSHGYKCIFSILLIGALFSPVIFGGCAVRGSYRVYDPAYEDYHVWGRNETVYYQRWEGETHRDHREFRQRSTGEQKEYWTWRHAHHDDDH
jgi:hypothetical protein